MNSLKEAEDRVTNAREVLSNFCRGDKNTSGKRTTNIQVHGRVHREPRARLAKEEEINTLCKTVGRTQWRWTEERNAWDKWEHAAVKIRRDPDALVETGL